MGTPLAAGKIIVLDFSDWRLERAREMVATHTLNPEKQDPLEQLHEINNGRGADAVFVTAGSRAAWELDLQLCERGGQIHRGTPPPPGDLWPAGSTSLYFSEIQDQLILIRPL
ncbi:MAG: hypothetical protein E3J37_07510 [Anaerolineales bacterium]|nr:MAG: hypothetical protein E3J37_07510 [Anaerolineales bacterium]